MKHRLGHEEFINAINERDIQIIALNGTQSSEPKEASKCSEETMLDKSSRANGHFDRIAGNQAFLSRTERFGSTMKNILIVGATSSIATACARRWVEEETIFFLVGRTADKLGQIAADLAARGATVQTHALDLNRFDQNPAMLDACYAALGKIDIALIAHGTLPDQKACEQDPQLAVQEFTNNGLSVIALLTDLANRMEAQKSGCIAVISSVAGDRGRPSNYLYGAAKGAVTDFCSGLRGRLFKSGVHVLTIKPGFVDTPMTQGLPLPKLLVATPDRVAQDIERAVEKRRDTVYTPWFWHLIMLIIIHIPERIFKRLGL